MNDNDEKKQFIPGLKLAEGFYKEVVRPVLDSHYAGLRYTAALIGSGSEVLGLDDEMSTDHHWGPRVMLFLDTVDYESLRDEINNTLTAELPAEYKGYSTNFSQPDPEDKNVQIMQPAATGNINHRVEIYTIESYFSNYLGIDSTSKVGLNDWLALPQQQLRSITKGVVFKDDLGLETIRNRFSWYPYDIWLYILASTWKRVSQEEHLMGRVGVIGDEIGSALIGSRLVIDIMQLCYLMNKEYSPYPKWFGKVFTQLPNVSELTPILSEVLHSRIWKERESALCRAYEIIARMHNSLEITEYISPEISQFFDRPFKVIQGERVVKAIVERINDPEVKLLINHGLIGNINTISDNTDLLENASMHTNVKRIFEW